MFMIYILGFHYIETSRYVIFDEDTSLKKSIRSQLEEVHEEDVPPIKVKAKPSPEIVSYEDPDMLEPQEPLTMDISWKWQPTWVREIIQEEENYGAPKGPTRTRKISKLFSSYVALMCDLVYQEPTSYEEYA